MNYVYTCPLCGKTFKKGGLRCTVIHAPGTCCHYGDTEVEVKPIDDQEKIKKIVTYDYSANPEYPAKLLVNKINEIIDHLNGEKG